MGKLKYYNFAKVMSYNAVYNFIIGARGLGKTYGAKKLVIKNYLKGGKQFIYLRRYDTELKTKNTWFADIAHEWPDYAFRVMGSEAQVCRNPDDKPKDQRWETMGYFIALSKAQSKKSVAYPRVTIIIFDEFIIDKGAIHYIPEEPKAMLDFYNTVDRWKDKTRVLFLANSVSVMNPYFVEYKIRPDKPGFYPMGDGFMVTHVAESAEFETAVYQTRLGKFIQGTEYAEYSIGNTFSDNTDNLVGRKWSDMNYFCTIETPEGTFSVWVDADGPFYHLQEKRPKKEVVYTLMPEKMTENKVMLRKSDKLAQFLRTGFNRGRMTFDSPQTRNAFTNVF